MDSNHRFLIAQVFRRNNFRGKRIGQDFYLRNDWRSFRFRSRSRHSLNTCVSRRSSQSFPLSPLFVPLRFRFGRWTAPAKGSGRIGYLLWSVGDTTDILSAT
jgi:hypothetical protein